MEQSLEKLSYIQNRLDNIESDPQWLNDRLAELKELIEEEQKTALGSLRLLGAIEDFEDRPSISALQSQMDSTALDMMAATIAGHILSGLPPTDLSDTSPEQQAKNIRQITRAVHYGSIAAIQVASTSESRQMDLEKRKEAMAAAAEKSAA